MHYNGTGWFTSATPGPGTRNNTVSAVDGVSGTDAWAVGYTLDRPYGNRIRDSLILHWNGTAWSQVPSPDNGSTYLYDVAGPADDGRPAPVPPPGAGAGRAVHQERVIARIRPATASGSTSWCRCSPGRCSTAHPRRPASSASAA